MRSLLLYASAIFALCGFLISVIGLLQINLGIPVTATGRTMVQLQNDGNKLLVGIGFLAAGIALLVLSCAVTLINLALGREDRW